MQTPLGRQVTRNVIGPRPGRISVHRGLQVVETILGGAFPRDQARDLHEGRVDGARRSVEPRRRAPVAARPKDGRGLLSPGSTHRARPNCPPQPGSRSPPRHLLHGACRRTIRWAVGQWSGTWPTKPHSPPRRRTNTAGRLLEIAAHQLALGNRHRTPGQVGPNEVITHVVVRVKLAGDQLVQHGRALRVPDEHDPCPLLSSAM